MVYPRVDSLVTFACESSVYMQYSVCALMYLFAQSFLERTSAALSREESVCFAVATLYYTHFALLGCQKELFIQRVNINTFARE
jgi:hypothetical protein